MGKDYKPAYNRVYTTLRHEEPDIVPVFCGMGTFAIGYAGSTLEEVESSWEKEAEVFLKPYERLYCDAIHSIGVTYGPRGAKIIGSPSRFISPDGCTLQHLACTPMNEDEYDKLIADPEGFIWNSCVPRTAADLALGYEQKKKSISELMDYLDGKFMAWEKISTSLRDDYGIIALHDAPNPYPPLDLISDYLRDIHGMSVDLRRRPQKVLEACEALEDYCMRKAGVCGVEKINEYPMYGTYLHFPPFMSAAQFDKFFAPTYTRIIKKLNDLGGKLILFLEGEWLNKADWLASLPKDFICAVYEGDDI